MLMQTQEDLSSRFKSNLPSQLRPDGGFQLTADQPQDGNLAMYNINTIFFTSNSIEVRGIAIASRPNKIVNDIEQFGIVLRLTNEYRQTGFCNLILMRFGRVFKSVSLKTNGTETTDNMRRYEREVGLLFNNIYGDDQPFNMSPLINSLYNTLIKSPLTSKQNLDLFDRL